MGERVVIAIVGTSGAGETTLVEQVVALLGDAVAVESMEMLGIRLLHPAPRRLYRDTIA